MFTRDWYSPIGILGGMGPAATADLYMRIIRYFQREHAAVHDKDFPRIVIESLPVPDLVGRIEDELLTRTMLCEAAGRLERSGCEIIAIACNSVQFLLDDIQCNVSIPVMSVAESASREVERAGVRSLGLLATETTIKRGIYNLLKARGVTLVYPSLDDQQELSRLILEELAGKRNEDALQRLSDIGKRLAMTGAEAVALACTELPLIAETLPIGCRVINCSEIYACDVAYQASRWRVAGGRRKVPGGGFPAADTKPKRRFRAPTQQT